MAGCFAGCWWNKCVLICTETWLRKADTEPNFKLWEGFFLKNSVFFFSFSWQAHFSSLSRMAAGSAIITLYSITEHSIMGLCPTAFMLVTVNITDGALQCKVLKAHKFFVFNKSAFCVWCPMVCKYCQNTTPGQELYVYRNAKDPWLLSNNFSFRVLCSTKHSFRVDTGIPVLLKSPIM